MNSFEEMDSQQKIGGCQVIVPSEFKGFITSVRINHFWELVTLILTLNKLNQVFLQLPPSKLANMSDWLRVAEYDALKRFNLLWLYFTM